MHPEFLSVSNLSCRKFPRIFFRCVCDFLNKVAREHSRIVEGCKFVKEKRSTKIGRKRVLCRAFCACSCTGPLLRLHMHLEAKCSGALRRVQRAYESCREQGRVAVGRRVPGVGANGRGGCCLDGLDSWRRGPLDGLRRETDR
jgi:hypothetical protein